MKYLVSTLALLAAASGAYGQPVYKSTMPDGKVVYGEKPVPGAKRVDTVETPPAKAGVSAITPQEKARAAQNAARSAPAATQQARIEQARKTLEQAIAAAESGKEPLPGERQGLAGGGSRLTEAYFARQKALAAQVEAARKQLDQISSGR